MDTEMSKKEIKDMVVYSRIIITKGYEECNKIIEQYYPEFTTYLAKLKYAKELFGRDIFFSVSEDEMSEEIAKDQYTAILATVSL